MMSGVVLMSAARFPTVTSTPPLPVASITVLPIACLSWRTEAPGRLRTKVHSLAPVIICLRYICSYNNYQRFTERAPLLTDSLEPVAAEPTFVERVTSVLAEPLTGLSKVLLVIALILLLLASVFIGLFAGAQHKLNTGRGAPGQTTTVVSTATTTATTTAITTRTISKGLPVPTGTPEEVRRLHNGPLKACILQDNTLMTSLFKATVLHLGLHPSLGRHPRLHRHLRRPLRELLRVR
jgi:hypothetical protein